MDDLRELPSVEKLLQTPRAVALTVSYGRPLTLQAIRTVMDEIRAKISRIEKGIVPKQEEILNHVEDLLETWIGPTLIPVINASGVVLHTNLGRAPLSEATLVAMDAVARSYSTLEFDLVRGKRGSRFIHAEAILQKLTGVEAAMVVNNNAAAILLSLSALANRRRVVIARSQLIEIGGGFRIPDVMKQSGAKMIEIGTTNRINLRDYEQALEEPTAMVLHAHRSNFNIVGFTEEPELMDIVDLAHKSGVPVLYDLGSGSLLATEHFGLGHEPTVQESLATGADLVCFSGDKLLGGPQAGIIIGRENLIAKIKKHPLARAVRADKCCLAGIASTLLHYLKDEAEREIPIWRMISLTPELIQACAIRWARELRKGEVIASESTIGGGSLPGDTLPTFVLSINVKNPVRFQALLREQRPPVITRIDNDNVLIDPRTVLPEQEGSLLAALRNALMINK